jgi:hypothetical protein
MGCGLQAEACLGRVIIQTPRGRADELPLAARHLSLFLSGTRMTIVSFTRAMSEENDSLLTPFIGLTRAFKGFTSTESAMR